MSQSILESAEKFAIERHGSQMYGNDKPYFWHLGKVAGLLEALNYPLEIQVAGWLHDTVEDTETSIEEIRERFGDKVAEMVEGVTFSKDDKAKGVDKMKKSRSNPGSQVVKFADASVNYSTTVIYGAPAGKDSTETINRYLGYMRQLSDDLPTPDEVSDWLAS